MLPASDFTRISSVIRTVRLEIPRNRGYYDLYRASTRCTTLTRSIRLNRCYDTLKSFVLTIKKKRKEIVGFHPYPSIVYDLLLLSLFLFLSLRGSMMVDRVLRFEKRKERRNGRGSTKTKSDAIIGARELGRGSSTISLSRER